MSLSLYPYPNTGHFKRNNMEDKLIEEHSFYKYANEVAEICKPLFDQTPINYFCQARIYVNNDYGGLLSDKTWAYFYLKNDFQLLSVEPQLASQGCSPIFWNLNNFKPTCKKTQKLVDACVLFQHACGVMFIIEYEEYKEVFLFSTAHDVNNTDPYLAQNINLLMKFILYFKENINNNKKLAMALSKRYHNEILIPEALSVQNKEIVDFKIKKYYLGEFFPHIAFSKREAECLKYLHRGKSAKEIGRLLKLSHRTIETHINNIKEKTQIKSLAELLIKLEKCSFLNAIE